MTLNSILLPLFFIFIFPGFLFLTVYGFFLEWLDKKTAALMQNKPGPAIYLPVTDFITLLSKENNIGKYSRAIFFKFPPAFAITAIITSVLLIPVWEKALFSFQGDLIVALFLLTIPSMAFFLAGSISNKPFAAVNELKTITQLFAYEALFLLALLGPAILAGSWSIVEISKFMFHRPLLLMVQFPAFLVALITLQGKLKRFTFDSINRKTETEREDEYSGGTLAFFKLAINMEIIAGAALINAIFLGGALNFNGVPAIGFFILKTMSIVFSLSILKVILARRRINQIINLCWKIMAPLTLLQISLNIFIKLKMQ